MTGLATLTLQDFEKLLQKAFEVRSVSPSMELTLVDVKAMGSGVREGGAFSVLWQGAAGPVLEQGLHSLYQQDFGEQEIFLVPVAEKDVGIQYEAVFT